MSKIKKALELPTEIFHNRKLVFSLAKNDFKNKFAGSYFGLICRVLSGDCLGFCTAYRNDSGILVCIQCGFKGRERIQLSLCVVSDFRNCTLVLFSGCTKRRYECTVGI